MSGNPTRSVRASALPSYNDCARRTAAKTFPQVMEAAGFAPRKLLPSVGAAVGTATHAAVATVLRSKMADPERPLLLALTDGVVEALALFREEIQPGAEWDETTPNLQVAEFQIDRLARAYLPVAELVTPAAVELELRAQVGDGWELTGHVDLLTAEGHLDDLKTGAVRRPYQAQLGAYALLARANGHEITSTGITFVPRGKKTKPQPPPERQLYELPVAESSAWATVQNVKRDVMAFEASKDPEAFPANPMSLMCSARYCPAWGTSFCRMHLPAEREEIVD